MPEVYNVIKICRNSICPAIESTYSIIPQSARLAAYLANYRNSRDAIRTSTRCMQKACQNNDPSTDHDDVGDTCDIACYCWLTSHEKGKSLDNRSRRSGVCWEKLTESGSTNFQCHHPLHFSSCQRTIDTQWFCFVSLHSWNERLPCSWRTGTENKDPLVASFMIGRLSRHYAEEAGREKI